MRKYILLILGVFVFGVATAVVHVDVKGAVWVQNSQVRYMECVLDGTGGNPGQYRVLVPWVMRWALDRMGESVRWSIDLVLLVRMVSQVLLFGGLALYLTAFGITTERVLVGMSVFASAMMNGVRYSDLSFATYLDVAFYLLVTWMVLRRLYLWTLPLVVLAGLNRETSGLLPFVVLAASLWDTERRGEIFGVALGCMAIWCAEFVALRMVFGPQALQSGYNGTVFPNLWRHNMTHPLGWMILLLTLGMLPGWTAWRWRFLPEKLRLIFWAVVPVWVVLHTLGGNYVEARLFLVPQVLVFLPAFLLTFGKGKQELALLKLVNIKEKLR